MFKKFKPFFLLLILGHTLNAAGVVPGCRMVSNFHSYAVLAAQQKLEIWHDVKPVAFYGLGLSLSVVCAIEAYQEIPKASRGWLKQRIDALNHIVFVSNSRTESIALLHQTAKNKALYLQGILEQKPFLKALRLEDMPDGSSLRTGLGVKRDYFKDEFIVHLDPAFRTENSMGKAFMEWNKAAIVDSRLPEFYLWLEIRQDLAFEVEPVVRKYGLVGVGLLKARRIYFDENGTAYNALYGDKERLSKIFEGALGWPLKPSDDVQGYLYNIDQDGNLYIGSSADVPKHSYILRGKLLQSAGHIKFNSDGFIITIDTSSGHYQPSPSNFKKALELLVSNNGSKILSKADFFGYYEPLSRRTMAARCGDGIPDIGKPLYEGLTAGASGNDLLKLKGFLMDTELQEIVADPFLENKKITLQNLLQKLEDNKFGYVEALASLKEAQEKLDSFIFSFVQDSAEEVLAQVLKKYFCIPLKSDHLLDEAESNPALMEYYHSIVIPFFVRLQETVSFGDVLSAFQKLPDIFQGLSALTNNSQFKCMLFKYHKDLKYWPGDNSIRYDGQRLSPLVKFCRVLKEIDSTIHYEAIDQVMIGETPYLLNKAMEYYDGLVLEKLEIEGKIKEIREKFERPLVNSPVLVAALRRQVQCCRAKLAIKDAMPAIRARAQAMQAALQTSD